MYKFKIVQADEVRIGDIVTAAVTSDDYPRDIHWVGEILEIIIPHEDITGFKVNLLAHCDNEVGKVELGLRHERKVSIIRKVN